MKKVDCYENRMLKKISVSMPFAGILLQFYSATSDHEAIYSFVVGSIIIAVLGSLFMYGFLGYVAGDWKKDALEEEQGAQESVNPTEGVSQ